MTATVLVPAVDGLLELWVNEAPGLRLYFRRALNGDRDTAEDLTAETFTQLATAMERGTVESAEGLLRRIAQARLTDEIRRRRDDPELPAGLMGTEEGSGNHTLPELIHPAELSYEASAFQARFDRAVRALPEPERDAFILTELRGLSHEEAASVLGTSHTTVGKRSRLATDTVRRALLAG